MPTSAGALAEVDHSLGEDAEDCAGGAAGETGEWARQQRVAQEAAPAAQC
ncbi:MAG TPA: hypothetical protein VH561_08675 [Micromonosporaceae bacterium]